MRDALDLEKKALASCAELMASAARTSPKTRGRDNIITGVIDDRHELKDLAENMRRISKRDNRPSLERDAGNIENLEMVFLLGVKDNPAGLNCGYCGCKTCDAMKERGGICAFNSIDLGIACGSSAGVAARLHVDNRVMYSIGLAALEMGLFPKDVKQALGIPLSVSGKNPFFDRKITK